MTQKHHISVCICTFKRPKQLERLLWTLEKQETEGLFNYSLVIVDNDGAESARQIVEYHARQSNISLSYHVEQQQNIALARNRAIKNAKGDFIGFIDDDELPDSAWLLTLYRAINSYDADGILGPVLPSFEKEPPKWIMKGRVFERPTHATGYILDWKNTRTGNALVRRNLFKEDREWFQHKFGSGGEDRDFFRRKITQGHVFIWCAEAPVYEAVPPKRWEKKILIKRALLRGKMALNSSKPRIINILISLAAMAVYTVWLPFFFVLSPILGFHVFMKYLIKWCDHIGKISAFIKIELVREKYID